MAFLTFLPFTTIISMSSTNEYVDCCASALNWWKGPMETNSDGTVTAPFLEWVDERNQTGTSFPPTINLPSFPFSSRPCLRTLCLYPSSLSSFLPSDHAEFYKEHSYYPGLHAERDNLPHSLAQPGSPAIPVPAVSYKFFQAVVAKYKIRFKDLSGDQCGTCNKTRADIKGATPAERPALVAAWDRHKRQADKGHVHRAKRKGECVALWNGVVLPPSTVTDFPPPPSLR